MGTWLVVGIAALSIAASARQAPLHALTTEIVGPEVRGEYIAVRNAASQIGIAAVATVSAYAFDCRRLSRRRIDCCRRDALDSLLLYLASGTQERAVIDRAYSSKSLRGILTTASVGTV